LTFIAFLALLIWVLTTSVLVWRLAPATEAPAEPRTSPA
jgi:hypothetical protein